MIWRSPAKFALSLALALSFAACSSKPNDSVPPHLGPVPTVEATSKKKSQSPAEVRAKFLALDIGTLAADVKNFGFAEHRDKSFTPLSELFFSVQFLEDPYKGKIEHDLPKALWAFQYSAIRLIDSQVDDSGKITAQGRILLDEFISIYTYGCERGKWRNCKFLEFFSQDSQTADIIRRYVKYTDLNVEDYYRYLQLVFKPHSHRADPELSSLIMARAIENIRRFVNIEYVGEVCKQAKLTTVDFTPSRKAELGRFVDFVILTMQTSGRYGDLELSKEMIVEFFTWLQSGQIEFILGTQFSYSVTKFISARLKEEQLWPSFHSALKCREKFAIDRLTDIRERDPNHKNLLAEQAESYTTAVWDILNFDSNLIERMNLKIIDLEKLESKDDQIYYYIASLLYQNTPFEEILPYWESTEKDGKRMAEIMESFMRVHLVHNTLLTNVSMANIYRGEQAEKLHPSEFMTQVRSLADGKITPLWMEYFRSLANMKSFFEGEIDVQLGANASEELSKAVAEMRNFFDYINLNVKYFVTYPNILMFSYFAKVLNYKEHIYIWFLQDTIEINANIIMQEYLKGTLPPLFRFTNYEGDSDGIDEVEVMYSIYFAMKLNMFELYGVDPLDWFRRFVESYLLTEKDKLRTWAKKLRDNFENGSTYDRMMEECHQVKNFRAGRPVDTKILTKMTPKRAFEWTFRGRLGMTSSDLTKLAQVLGGGGYFDSSVPEALEIVRSDVDSRLSKILLIKNLMSKVYIDVEVDGKLVTFDDMLPVINREIRTITDIRDEILDNGQRLDETITDCVLTLDKEEHQRQAEVLEMELDFLGLVYTALDALNNMDHAGKSIAQLREEYPNAEIWKNVFFDSLPEMGQLYDSVNELFEEKAHYTKAFAAMAGYEKNFEALIGIDNRGSYFMNYYGYDVAIRLASFIKHGFNGKEVSLKADIIELAFPATYKEFYTNFVNWQRGKDSWQRKVDYLPTPQLGFAQNLANFQTSAIFYLASEDGSDVGAYAWTDYYDWHFGVGRYIRRLIQSRVQVHRMKFERDTDPKTRALCDDECIAAEKARMREESKSILDLSKRSIDHVSLNGITNFDMTMLKHYDYTSFFGFNYGPTYLFTEYNATGVQIIVDMADDAYTYMTAYHLGKHSAYRGIRKYAEDASEDKPAQDMNDLTTMFFHQRTNYWTKAETYYKTLERQERELLIDIDPEVLSYINFSMTWRMQTEMRLMEAFEDAIEDYEINDMHDANPLWFRTSMDPYNHGREVGDMESRANILREKLPTDYHSKIREFNDKTKGIFLPKEFKNDFNWETVEFER